MGQGPGLLPHHAGRRGGRQLERGRVGRGPLRYLSAADALLVAKAGKRSGSKDHEDVADLIMSQVRHPRAKEQARRLRRILQEKNLIEYVDKSYRQADALEIQKHVERFTAWVQPQLGL